MAPNHGWDESADAWIQCVDEGDVNRTLFLDPVMLDWAGNVRDLDVLDVGCGEGRFCRMLAHRGARCVGIDPIDLLIQVARERGHAEYHLARAERLPCPDAAFDLVVSYVSLVDVPGYREGIAEMARVTRAGGRILVANVSTIFTCVNTGWVRDAFGERLYVPVDDYVTETGVEVAWRDIRVVNWHRPLAAYLTAFLEAGLILRRFDHPIPPDEAIRARPGLADNRRVPNFDVMLWERPCVDPT